MIFHSNASFLFRVETKNRQESKLETRKLKKQSQMKLLQLRIAGKSILTFYRRLMINRLYILAP